MIISIPIGQLKVEFLLGFLWTVEAEEVTKTLNSSSHPIKHKDKDPLAADMLEEM